jgi:hypothetical protein
MARILGSSLSYPCVPDSKVIDPEKSKMPTWRHRLTWRLERAHACVLTDAMGATKALILEVLKLLKIKLNGISLQLLQIM